MKSRESIGKRIIDSAPSIFRSTKDSSDILERTENLNISKHDISYIELRNNISRADILISQTEMDLRIMLMRILKNLLLCLILGFF